jgi:hypothetical protein
MNGEGRLQRADPTRFHGASWPHHMPRLEIARYIVMVLCPRFLK